MRRTITNIDPTLPVQRDNILSNQFKIFLREVYNRGLIIGSGSPDSVIEAEQGQEYLDEDGLAGSIKWIKQKADIGGDRTQGWVAIG